MAPLRLLVLSILVGWRRAGIPDNMHCAGRVPSGKADAAMNDR